jgi:hypothetical protein
MGICEKCSVHENDLEDEEDLIDGEDDPDDYDTFK